MKNITVENANQLAGVAVLEHITLRAITLVNEAEQRQVDAKQLAMLVHNETVAMLTDKENK